MQTKRTNQITSPPSYRIVRGTSGLWEVVEEGIRGALALFKAPQAALSYACALAAVRKGSVVVVFHKLPLGRTQLDASHGARFGQPALSPSV